MSRILFSIFLLFAGMQILVSTVVNERKQLQDKFTQFADEVNCEVANYLIKAPGVYKPKTLDCTNCNYDKFKEEIKNNKYKKVVEDLNKIQTDYCKGIISENIINIVEKYCKRVVDTVHATTPKQSNFESWEKGVTSKKDLFKAYIGTMKNGLISKVWNYLKYPLLILLILIIFALLFIEYRNLISKMKEKDKFIFELQSQLRLVNNKLNRNSDKNNSSFSSSNDLQSKTKTNNEILEDAIVKFKNSAPSIPGSILFSLIESKRSSWLGELDTKYNEKLNISESDKRQFIIGYLKDDVERTIKDDYYELKKVTELLEVQNLLEGQEWLKKYKRITPERVEQIARIKANEHQNKLSNENLITKVEFDKLKLEILKGTENTIREEESNMDTIMYSSQPVGEGYFIKEKLSDEILGQHMYKILISAKYPDTARFQFLFDNEKAMKTAIASYSTALVPVCILERDNTKGERIVPSQDNAFGTLRLENDRWKVQEKLRIRIV